MVEWMVSETALWDCLAGWNEASSSPTTTAIPEKLAGIRQFQRQNVICRPQEQYTHTWYGTKGCGGCVGFFCWLEDEVAKLCDCLPAENR